MTNSAIILVLSYLVIISTLLWLNKANFKSRLCILYIPFCIWYSFTIGFSLNGLLGYPTDSMIPDKAVIKGIHINEPRKDYAGSMCFWVMLPDQLGKHDAEPRAYRLPYDKELHKQLMKQSKGKRVMIWNLKSGDRFKSLMALLGKKSNISSYGEFRLIDPVELLQKETISP